MQMPFLPNIELKQKSEILKPILHFMKAVSKGGYAK
jgi:hypothetical protein